MPIVSLKLRPGLNAEFTETLNEAGISSCNLIRFETGLPQKLGGWTRFYPNAVPGIPRDMHAWGDLNSVNRLSVGTTTALDVLDQDGGLNDITPQTLITDTTPDFDTTMGDATVQVTDPEILNLTTYDAVFFNTPISVGGIVLRGVRPIASITGTTSYTVEGATEATADETAAGVVPIFDSTSGSAIMTVTFPDHGLSVGSDFTFPISTAVGGVTVLGTYPVLTVADPDTFTIGVNVEASSTETVEMNGGDVQFLYFINLGPPAAGIGYGLGGYGDGGYGTGVTSAAQTGDPITATNWSQDNWGEYLLACPFGGGIYYWPPNSGYETAFFIPTAPVFNGGIFVAMPEQILVAWGSTAAAPLSSGANSSPEQRDPLIVRWSDALDFTVWDVTSTTQAGSFHIPTGSAIIGALQGPQQALIFTDIEVWAMSYLGPPLVFGFNKLSAGCGLIAQHAVGVLRGLVFWMSQGSFFMLTGNGVQEVPCPVWDIVFQDLDTDNQDKIACAPNSQFSEIAWYFPSISGGTGENDKYIKLNLTEGTWDYGTLDRSAWIDQTLLGQPIGASSAGMIYQHETSNDADGQPINAWFETGYFVIAEGQQFAFVDWFFPDMKWGTRSGTQDAIVSVTITAVDYPNGTPRVYGPFDMSNAQEYINTRLRGRQIKLLFESNDLGSFWRLGNVRYRVAMDGRR